MDNKKVKILTVIVCTVMATVVSSMVTGDASAEEVSGYVSTDTTWTLSDSPYVLTSNVVIEVGVTLTIEPGVVVKFDGPYELVVDGTLMAQGNATNSITFTSNSTTPNPGDWLGIKFRDTSADYASTIDWVTLMYSSEGISFEDSSQNMSHVDITNNEYGIYFRSGVLDISISNSNMYSNTYGLRAGGYFDLMGSRVSVSHSNIFNNTHGFYGAAHSSFSVSNSNIYSNNYGLGGGGGSWSISDSEIYDNTYGMGEPNSGSRYTVSNSTIYDNTYGVYVYGAYGYYGSASVSDSNISNNRYGIYGYSTYGSLSVSQCDISNNLELGVSTPGPLSMENSSLTNNGGNGIEVSKGGAIHHSNIHGNASYDVKMTGSDDVDASLNWWGTTDVNLIESKVYDYYDDYQLGKVNYIPIRTSPIVESLTDVTAVSQIDKFNGRFNRRTGQLSMMFTWTNIGANQFSEPLHLVIESITPDTVTVTNADGTTGDDKPYYDFSNSVGDGKLDPGETSEAKEVVFHNPNRVRFELVLSCWAKVEGGGAAPRIKPLIGQAKRIHIVIPGVSSLAQNFPNPFNPDTWIPYEIANASDVKIVIYDIQGRLVRVIDLGHREIGQYITKEQAAYWDGRNNLGEKTGSGIYFYQIQAGDFKAMRKMVILK